MRGAPPLVRPFVVLLLAVAGPVQAGTEERPELSDPANDHEPQELPIPLRVATAHADVLAAWIHEESDWAFKVTLKLGRLDGTTTGTYNLVWVGLRNDTEVLGIYGVRARMNQTLVHYSTIYSPDAAVPVNEFPETHRVEGRNTRGTPAYITWTVPFENFAARPGDRYAGFFAATYLENPSGDELPPADQARDEDHDYVLAVDVRTRVEAFDPPTRPPDFTDPSGDVGARASDLTGVWIEYTSDAAVEVVFGLRALGVADEDCSWVGEFVLTPRRGADPAVFQASAEFEVRRDELEPRGLGATSEAGDVPVNLTARMGEPGFVRFTAPRRAWTGPTELDRVSSTASTYCQGASDSLDVITHSPRGAPGPGPLGLAGALAFSVIAARRRKL